MIFGRDSRRLLSLALVLAAGAATYAQKPAPPRDVLAKTALSLAQIRKAVAEAAAEAAAKAAAKAAAEAAGKAAAEAAGGAAEAAGKAAKPVPDSPATAGAAAAAATQQAAQQVESDLSDTNQARIQISGVIDPSDITYVGAIRMPLQDVDTSFAYGGLAGRQVNGRTRFFLYGRHTGDLSTSDAVYELEDPGSGYTTDYTQAPRASLVTTWGDIYHGLRQTWTGNGATVAGLSGSQYPGGLYWNESTQLLYWTYYDAYNVGGRPDWGLGASHLDDPATAASTAYGPWRALAVDGDGQFHYGPGRCLYLFANPFDGSMMCGSSMMSGNVASPWGPDAYGGAPWPVQSTPAGFNAPDVIVPDRYLEYYFMGNSLSNNYVDTGGVVHGDLRSFRRTTELPIWENSSVSHSDAACQSRGERRGRLVVRA